MFLIEFNDKPVDFIEVNLPSSKSISNRILIINALLKNIIQLKNLSDSDDTKLMQLALSKSNSLEINLENAGTCMRFLLAYFSAIEGTNINLLCSKRMEERPIQKLVNVLTDLGAEIEYLSKENFPPLKIVGKNLKGKSINIDASESSQFVTALMLIAPFIENGLSIKFDHQIASFEYIKMTILLMQQIGFEINLNENTIEVLPLIKQIEVKEITIEQDWSGAAFWYLICVLKPDLSVNLNNLFINSIQGDKATANIFENLGIETIQNQDGVLLKNNQTFLNEVTFDLRQCIDLAPALSVGCAVLNIHTKINGLKNLVFKESNRLTAICNELNKLGYKAIYYTNSIEILPVTKIDFDIKVTVNSYHDHRIIMAFAPLSILFKNLSIDNIGAVSKSYPNFFDELKMIGIETKQIEE